MSLEIVDYQLVFGSMSMNRDECRLNGIYDFSYGLPPNAQLLLAQISSLVPMDQLKIHLQLTVKVRSSLGLRLVDLKTHDKHPVSSSASSLLLGRDDVDNRNHSEVHFFKMEGQLAC